MSPGNRKHIIGLAGCGKMGSAMVRGWLSGGVANHIYILDPNGLPPEWMGHDKITYCSSDSIFLGHAAECDILVIAIKPQMMDAFCDALKKHLPPSLPVLSIAAGRTIESFRARFGSAQPLIRAMPNTPAAIGKGITVVCAAENVEEQSKQMANDLLSTLGLVEWIDDETRMDAVTAVSGSGPAYVFYLIEALAQSAIENGLYPDLAMTLARQTVIGAAALAEDDAQTSAAALRENVTSPNGTTAAALSILMDGRLQKLMDEAVAKATARSKELSK